MEYLAQCASLIEAIAATSATKEKERLLANGIAIYGDHLITPFRLAYDPYVTYGIKQIPTPTTFSNRITSRTFNTVLNQLARRELTGNTAKLAVQNLLESVADKRQADVITGILKKDLRCGIRVKTINKVLKKVAAQFERIPTFDIMLASSDTSKIKFPCIVEPKLDGVRCITVFDSNGEPTLYSRSGRVFEAFPSVREKLRGKFNDYILDGEIVATTGSFQDLMTQVRRKDKRVTVDVEYVPFDYLPQNQFAQQKSTIIYKDRIDMRNTHKLAWINSEIAKDQKYLEYLYRSYLEAGYEGIVVKDPNATYAFKRSSAWIKIKPAQTYDLFVQRVVEGTGKYRGKVGALQCLFFSSNKNTKIVSVGSGLSAEIREKWWKEPELIKNMWIEVKAQEVTRDGSLRFPTFLRVREEIRTNVELT